MGHRRFPWPTLCSATVTVALSTRVQRATFSRIMKNELKWLPKFWHIKYMGRYYSLTKIIPTRQQYEQIDVTLIGMVSFCILVNVRWNWGDSTNTWRKRVFRFNMGAEERAAKQQLQQLCQPLRTCVADECFVKKKNTSRFQLCYVLSCKMKILRQSKGRKWTKIQLEKFSKNVSTRKMMNARYDWMKLHSRGQPHKISLVRYFKFFSKNFQMSALQLVSM